MRAMIFAAGLGTRLKPLTDMMPKALVPLAGRTLLEWQVEKLRQAGIRDIVVNVHHKADQIIDFVAQHDLGCRIQISDECEELLDTGGGLRKAQELLIEEMPEPILVCNVDILSNLDLPLFIRAYHTSHEPLSMLVVSDRPTQRYLLWNEQLELYGWTNIKTGECKPSSIAGLIDSYQKLAFSGMQIVSPRIFEKMDDVVRQKGDKFSLIDLYLSLVETEVLKAYIPENYKMMDVGKIDQLAEAEQFARTLSV